MDKREQLERLKCRDKFLTHVHGLRVRRGQLEKAMEIHRWKNRLKEEISKLEAECGDV